MTFMISLKVVMSTKDTLSARFIVKKEMNMLPFTSKARYPYVLASLLVM
jgi:hypothetical protein